MCYWYGLYHVGARVGDAHDAREAPPAQRARPPLVPQLPDAGGAGDAQAAVPALDEDGVGEGVEADHARLAALGRFGV